MVDGYYLMEAEPFCWATSLRHQVANMLGNSGHGLISSQPLASPLVPLLLRVFMYLMGYFGLCLYLGFY